MASQGEVGALSVQARRQELPDRFYLPLPPVYHEVAAVIGWEHAVELGSFVADRKRPPSRRRQGGNHNTAGRLYVSRDISADAMVEVAEVIGADATEKLIRIYGGDYLEFSAIGCSLGALRNRAILGRIIQGWPAASVAATFDLSERQVRRICKAEGVNLFDYAKAVRALRRERLAGVREAVANAVRLGESIVDAARQWGFAPDVAHAIAGNRG